MAPIKKNKIWITKNGLGYAIDYNGERVGKSKSSYNWPNNANFHDAIDALINTSDDFYEKGIKIVFDKDSKVEIPLEEKVNLSSLIRRLESSAKDKKSLKKDLNAIFEIVSKH